ncbi:MAG: hypothetical protein FJW86_04190 [Actinobacteria bacterium]|nr:hypothetical protein [Actinomycetota bacterium]
MFVLASAHFVFAGTDAASPVTVAVILLAVLAVVTLTGYRIHKVIAAATPTAPTSPPEDPGFRHAQQHRVGFSVPKNLGVRPAPVFWSSDGARVAPPPRRAPRPAPTGLR